MNKRQKSHDEIVMAFFIGGVSDLENHESALEKLKEKEIENNPFAVYPKTVLEKALEVLADFTEDIKAD